MPDRFFPSFFFHFFFLCLLFFLFIYEWIQRTDEQIRPFSVTAVISQSVTAENYIAVRSSLFHCVLKNESNFPTDRLDRAAGNLHSQRRAGDVRAQSRTYDGKPFYPAAGGSHYLSLFLCSFILARLQMSNDNNCSYLTMRFVRDR